MWWKNTPRKKQFKLEAEQMKPLAEGHGGCIASDMITIDGRKVACMYRDPPSYDEDSGWVFLSGYESDKYMDDPANHGVYDVNTIANYDPEIIPFLDNPSGSAFERENGEGPFKKVHNFEPMQD